MLSRLTTHAELKLIKSTRPATPDEIPAEQIRTLDVRYELLGPVEAVTRNHDLAGTRKYYLFVAGEAKDCGNNVKGFGRKYQSIVERMLGGAK